MVITVAYNIIGSGSAQDSPVKVEVDGKETSASITYTVRTIEECDCETRYVDNRYSQTISLKPLTCDDKSDVTSSSTISIVTGNPETELTVYFTVVQKHFECETPPECECSCDIIRSWTIPYYIDDDYPDNGDVNVYYEYWRTNADTNGNVCSREKKINYKSYKKSELPATNPFKVTADTECNKGNKCVFDAFTASTTGGCTSVASVTLNVVCSTIPEEISAKGGNVTVVCNFKRITIDTECNTTVKTGSFSITKEVLECPSSNTECCFDHLVHIPISVADLKRLSKTTGNNVIVYYNNEKVEGQTIEVPITMIGRKDGVCTDTCEDEITCCIVDGSLKLYHEILYGSDEWEEGGTVPCTGGRIKAEWRYNQHRIKCQEQEGTSREETTELTYSEIFDVGGCDESSLPDSYEILFKKQTDGCQWPSKIVGNEKFNKIIIEPTKVCPCEPANCDCNSILVFRISDGDTPGPEPPTPTD